MKSVCLQLTGLKSAEATILSVTSMVSTAAAAAAGLLLLAGIILSVIATLPALLVGLILPAVVAEEIIFGEFEESETPPSA